MLRILKAFAWMRWRVLMNSLERTGARDTIERLSLAVEQIAPLIAIGLLIPSAAALAALGAYAGYWLAAGSSSLVLTFEALVFLLVAACVLSVVGPMLLPSTERTNAVRLLLLPISRGTLYTAQAAGTVSDPWILLALPIVLFIPLGLAAGGAPGAAAIALVAGILLAIVLTGLTTLASLILHFVVRDRRRAELAALLFIVVVPMAMLLPTLLDANRHPGKTDAPIPEWLQEAARHSYRFVPAEQFAAATRASARGTSTPSPLLTLTALAAVLHGLGFWTLGRLLDSPASTGRRPSSAAGRHVSWRIPGLSRPSTAVARAHLRLVMRTPRGRSTLLSPVLVFVLLALMMRRGGGDLDIGAISLHSGLGLGTLGSAVSLLSILPFSVNQFAIDGAGLTLAFLAPLDDRQLLAGKAAANTIVACGQGLLCVLVAYALFPSGAAALWLSLPFGLLATSMLVAPAAAVLSSLFPRAVDLNSIGRGSNPHGLSNLLGLLSVVIAGAPAVVCGVATSALGRQELTLPLMVAWCGIGFGLSRGLFKVAEHVFARRRENLAMVV